MEELTAQICARTLTTGVIEGAIEEKSLILEINRGLALIIGCAPRIIKRIESIKSTQTKDIYYVSGRFHLASLRQPEIKEIIPAFRRLGVQKMDPSHYPGGLDRKLFSEEYGHDFVKFGAGQEISSDNDLRAQLISILLIPVCVQSKGGRI